jgi:hypothetical protein
VAEDGNALPWLQRVDSIGVTACTPSWSLPFWCEWR